jgi:dolichol kinase
MSDKGLFLAGEVGRQFIHMLTGAAFLIVIYLSGRYAVLVFAVLLAAAVFASVLIKKFNLSQRTSGVFRRLGRPGVQTVKLQGTILLLSGVLVTLLLFPRNIVYASVAIVALGDSVATIIGVLIGKHKLPYSENKTVEGTFSGLAAAFGGALLFVSPVQALLGAASGMFIESTIKLQTVREASLTGLIKFFLNDNFLIPVFSAFVMLVAGR